MLRHLISWLALLTLLTGAAHAGEPVWRQPFAAAPRELVEAIDDLPEPEDEAVQVVYQLAGSEFFADGRRGYRHHMVYRILDASAIGDWDRVEAEWNPNYQEAPQIRARVITPDGKVHDLDPQTVSTQPRASRLDDVLSDTRALVAPLPFIRVGATVEVETTVQDREPHFTGGVAGWTLIPSVFFMHDHSVTFRVHESLPFRYQYLRGEGPEPRRTEDDDWVNYDFQFGSVEAAELAQLFSTSGTSGALILAFSTGESWSSVARRYGEITESKLAGFEPTARVRELIDEGGTREQIIHRLAHHVRSSFRYTGLELGSTGIIPRRPEQVDQRGYGDCKDKATYLVACLRAAGVDANLALVLIGPDIPVPVDLPGLGIFDHMIVHIPGPPETWIDPTDEAGSIQFLPRVLQRRRALIVHPSTTELRETSGSTADQNLDREVRTYRLARYGPGSVVEHCHPVGLDAAAYRADYQNLGKSDYIKALREYAGRQYFSESVGEVELIGFDNPDSSLEIKIRVEESSLAITGQSDATAYLPTRHLFESTGELELEEGAPLHLFAPFAEQYEYRIEYPPWFSPVEVPESTNEVFGAASVSIEFEEADSTTLLALCEFRVDSTEVDAESAAELIDWINGTDAATAIQLEFKHRGESYLAAGHYREALREFRRERDSDPESALPLTRIARLYLEIGLGDAARQVAEDAIKLEPELSIAHRVHGIVLMNNALGMRLSGEFDREGASKSLKHALELDPEDGPARGHLSDLFATGDNGIVGGVGSDTHEAYRELLLLREETQSPDFDGVMLTYLMEAERVDELDSFCRLKNLDPTAKGAAELISASLDPEGSSVSQLAMRLNPESVASGALYTAATHLARLGRYPEASELLGLAAKRGAGSRGLGMSEFVTQMSTAVPIDSLLNAADTPRTPILRFVSMLLVESEGDPDWKQVFVERFIPDDDLEGLAQLRMGSLSSYASWLDEGAFPTSAVLDLFASTMEWKMSGDDEALWTVSVWMYGDEIMPGIPVMLTEDGYRIVTASAPWLPFAELAQDKLKKGDEESAERILSITRDLMPPEVETELTGGSLFARLWALRDSTGGPTLEDCVQAIMVAGENKSPRRHMEEWVQAYEGEGGEDLERSLVSEVIAGAVFRESNESLDRWFEKALAFDSRSEMFDHVLGSALMSRDRNSEYEQILLDRREANPEESWCRRTLADLRASEGRIAEAVRMLEEMVEEDKAGDSDLNQLAWYGICASVPEERHAALLQRAQVEDPSSLHTLSLLHACLGNLNEARNLALLALQGSGELVETADYLLISGKIAEQLGEPEIARSVYKQVIRIAQDSGPTSSQSLAERWVKELP